MEQPQYPSSYTIMYGDHKFIVDPKIFVKTSSKFRQYYTDNPEKLIIEDTKYELRSFMIFVAACMHTSFSIPNNNVKEVLAIAEEWGAPKLIEFCESQLGNIEGTDVSGLISSLIDKLKADEDPSDEINNVGRVVDEALKDERLLNLPMPIIYKIIDAGELKGMTPRALIDFTMKLFKKNPSFAVPLILRIDFDSLTEEEYQTLFTASELHEQSINFFAANAMSSINKTTSRQISLFKNSFEKTTQAAAKAIEFGEMNPKKDKQSTLIADVEEDRERDLDRFRQTLVGQQDTINDLVRALDAQQKALVLSIKRAHLAPTNDELLKRAQDELARTLEGGALKCRQMIDDDTQREKDALLDMQALAKKDLDRCMDELPPLDPEVLKEIDDFRAKFDGIERRLKEVQEELQTVRATMGAKIVHDKLRPDGFLRKTDNRFKLFGEGEGKDRLMDVDPNLVEEREAVIIDIEAKLTEMCPIKVKPDLE